MFNALFHYPRVLARHCEGPAANDRERFLAHCASGGAAHSTLLSLAPELLAIARRIKLDGNQSIPLVEIEVAADRWVAYQRRHHRVRTARFSRERFIQTAAAWLRFLGRLQEPEENPAAFADLVSEFDSYMREERGLSLHTIHNRCWHVQTFLQWFSEQGSGLAEIRLEQVDAFLALKRTLGWCRVSMATAVSALRSFFRYAGEKGWCSPGLAVGIEGPRLFSHESLPVGPKWEEVQRLIASTDTDCPQDIRDRAILLLLAIYGLRSGEVVALTLDDVGWEQDILHVSRPKQRCKQDYPLAAEVGEAILRYLQRVRPRIRSRSLFLTLRAPFRPLVATSLHYLVSTRLKALNICCPRRGPHALRHACATHLVAEGLSLKQIGDHLGHRSAYATRTYAKVDLVGLRQVADIALGDLL
jgi:site-specific recombinase XerD